MALKRTLGFKETLAIDIGAIIGAGIFVISGLAAGIAGPAVIIALVIGAIVSILTGLSFAQLAHSYAKEGGNYEYARRELGRYPGFIVGLTFVVSGIVGGAVMALSFGSYFASLFGAALSVPVVAALLVAILGTINYVGVKLTAEASLVLTVIKITVLVVFIAVGAFFIRPGNYVPFAPEGSSSIFVAAALVFFAYTGFARSTALGDEVKDPKHTIPKATVYSILISAVLYVAVVTVMVGIIPYGSLAASQSPLETAIRYATGDPILGYIIAIGALFATINVTLSMILGVSRVTFAMSRDDNLPKAARRTNRFGTPGIAVIVITAAMALSALAINFTEIASLSNAAALLSYALANVAAIRLTLRSRSTLFKSKYFAAVPIMGVISAVSLIFFLTTDILYFMAAMLIIVTIYYALLRRKGSPKKRPNGSASGRRAALSAT